MAEAVSVAEAARLLNRTPVTVRRWIVQGAPTISLGKEGRGHGSLVDVDALKRWRAGNGSADVRATDQEILQCVAGALWDVFKRDGGLKTLPEPVHVTLGFADWRAAGYLYTVFHRLAKELTGAVPAALPAEIKTLQALFEQTGHK